MKGMCLNKEANFKACPYRVYTQEHKAMMKGGSDFITQEFYACIGEECAAYHVGICLRLAGNVKEVE